MIFLYMVAMLGMLLIQIGSPVLSGKCTKLESCSTTFEIVIHVFISLSSLIFAAGVFYGSTICKNGDCATKKFDVDGIIVAIFVMSLVVLFILCSASFLLYLYIRFFRRVHVTKRVKWPVFRFSILLMLLVIDLAFEISFYWVLRETNLLIGDFTIDSYLLDFVFVVTVMAMLHLPSTRCCKKNKGVSHRPLLSNSNIHPTNPPSVWNHRNTPSSTTVFNPPPEMSDCVTE